MVFCEGWRFDRGYQKVKNCWNLRVWVVFDKMGLKVKSLIVTLNNEVLRQEVRVWRLLMSVVLLWSSWFWSRRSFFIFVVKLFDDDFEDLSTLFDFSIASFYDRLFRISLNHFKRSRFRRTFIFSGTPFKFLPIPFYNFRSRTFLFINLLNQTPL